jgi:hypothetical protein
VRRAYAQLARAYNTLSFKFSSQDDGRRFRENADVALAKAFDLNPNLAEAHFVRDWSRTWPGRVPSSRRSVFPRRRAVRRTRVSRRSSR